MAKNDVETGRPARRPFHPSRMTVLVLILLVVAIPVAFLVGMVQGRHTPAEPVITSTMLEEQLAGAQDLVSVEYHYTNVGKFENTLDFYGWSVPFTTKSFIITYDGTIFAGVDLSQCKIGVDEGTKTIHLTLPESRIISHEISEDSIQVFDETHNIFNQISISDYATFASDQKGAMEDKAEEKGLFNAASEKARSAIGALLAPVPGMDAYSLSIN